MKKHIVVLSIILIILLSGCGQRLNPNLTVANEVKIISKETEDNSKGRYTDIRYYLSIEKSGNKIRFRIDENLYKDVSQGSIADISYDENNIIRKITYKVQ